MKRRLLMLLLLPLLLAGCNEKDKTSYESRTAETTRRSGDIGSFNLLTPDNDTKINGVLSFTWEEANNCDSYQLEIAETDRFINEEDYVYVKESNIYATKFDLNYTLPTKDITYYWRVTAVNKDHKKECNAMGNFFYESVKITEIPINIEDEQDWSVHKEGSKATVSIDRNNFFGNNKNSLVINFKKEDTSQGISKSDGWIVITKSEDRELYGTDAFYLRFFYAGHDSTVKIRVLDSDGEYWHKQVQISNNAKQTVLMRFDEFTLRTEGTNIGDRVFGWQHIHYFEIVFEKTFGDGVCILSDIKAVRAEDYDDLFIKKLDFERDDIDDWTYENYHFDKYVHHKDPESSEPDPDDGALVIPVKAGFYGYGYQHVFFYKFFAPGDAVRFKIRFTGLKSNATFYFRILEEDRDMWQYRTPFSDLKVDPSAEDPYKELIIPLKAMQRMSSGMNGDGAKQFSYIQKLIFGLADNESYTGNIYIKDFEVVSLSEILDPSTRKLTVGANGCIENFDNYNSYTEIYYAWDQSAVNKDEAMKLDTIHRVGPSSNKYCAEFDYKADLEMATYQVYMNSEAAVDKNAFSIWLKDDSVLFDDPAVAYLKDKVAAEMTIQLTMDSGEWYRYVIPSVAKDWTNYTIAFKDFTLFNEKSLVEKHPLSSDHVIHMAFGLQYFYYSQGSDGNPDPKKPYPTYAIANPVYIDEIYFTNSENTVIDEISSLIKPDKDNPERITIDSFENYEDDDALLETWTMINAKDKNGISLSNDVSTEEVGGTKSLALAYNSTDSVQFNRSTAFHKKSLAKGMSLDLKGDDKARIVIHIDYRENGQLYDMRYIIHAPSSEWSTYEIGFDNFKALEHPLVVISEKTVKNIEGIRFVITNIDESESVIYLDNLRFLDNIAYDKEAVTVIPTAQKGGFEDEIN